MATTTCGSVEGHVSVGFEAVRTVFADNSREGDLRVA